MKQVIVQSIMLLAVLLSLSIGIAGCRKDSKATSTPAPMATQTPAVQQRLPVVSAGESPLPQTQEQVSPLPGPQVGTSPLESPVQP